MLSGFTDEKKEDIAAAFFFREEASTEFLRKQQF